MSEAEERIIALLQEILYELKELRDRVGLL